MGNWLTRTDQGRDTATTGIRNITQSFGSNRLNQLTGINTTYSDGSTGTGTISYDTRGNVAQNSDTKSANYSQYRFDDENRLFQIIVRRVSDNVVLTQTTFFYDGLGRKKWILEQDVVSGSYLNKRETFFAHDGMDVVRERENVYGTAGNTSTITTTAQQLTRVGNIGGILARTKQVNGQADRPSFYSYDGSGNVLSITDASQNVQCAYAYSGFGLEKAQEAVGWEQPYRYSTKWQHGASGLIDYGFRFYNPAWGRWINRDPIGESGGANVYGMVGNNPINYGDNNGLWGVQFNNGPNIGWGDPTFILLNSDAEEGRRYVVDTLDPFGNPWGDCGGYNPNDPVFKGTKYSTYIGGGAAAGAAGLLLTTGGAAGATGAAASRAFARDFVINGLGNVVFGLGRGGYNWNSAPGDFIGGGIGGAVGGRLGGRLGRRLGRNEHWDSAAGALLGNGLGGVLTRNLLPESNCDCGGS